jgi:hypothetical protein
MVILSLTQLTIEPLFFFAINKLIYTVIHKFCACFSSVPVLQVCLLG